MSQVIISVNDLPLVSRQPPQPPQPPPGFAALPHVECVPSLSSSGHTAIDALGANTTRTMSITSTIKPEADIVKKTTNSSEHKRQHRLHKKRAYVAFGTVKHVYAKYAHKIKNINRCGMILYYDTADSVPLPSFEASSTVSFSASHASNPSYASNASNVLSSVSAMSASNTEPNVVNATTTATNPTMTRTFVFAVDRRTRELTDTGGGVMSTDTSLISTAIRETREESLGIFDEILPVEYKFNEFSLYERAWAITDFKTLIIFWKIPPLDVEHKDKITAEFRRRSALVKCPEVIGVEWINTDQLETLLFPKQKKMKTTRIGGLADCPCNLVPLPTAITGPAGCIRMYDKVLRLLQSAGTNFHELP